MYSSNRLDLPTIASPRPTSQRRLDTIATHRVRLPRRIDVHRIDAVVQELSGAQRRGHRLDVDGSEVEMIDAFGLTALDELARTIPLSIRNASVALSKTAQYTGHRSLRDACAATVSFQKAA